ncbi:hypothetical protein ACVIGB_000013 [Bradyrhizobium sp. USDA 4341]
MKQSYQDILSRIAEAPTWFDEHGVPRYEAFAPEMLPDIYAREAVLFKVNCQVCAQSFIVAKGGRLPDDPAKSLRVAVDQCKLHYGDPPATGCCPSGTTMNSVPVKVIQLWRRPSGLGWERDVSRDGASIVPDWARDRADDLDRGATK